MIVFDRPILHKCVSEASSSRSSRDGHGITVNADCLVPSPALLPSLHPDNIVNVSGKLDSFGPETPRHYNQVPHTVCATTDTTVMLKSGLKRTLASLVLDSTDCPRKGGFQNKNMRPNRRRIIEDDTSSESSREENKENHNDEDGIRVNGARGDFSSYDGPSALRPQVPQAAQRASAISNNGKKRLMCGVACVEWCVYIVCMCVCE